MSQMIRPVSDLRNNFTDISKTVHDTQKPVFLTKNGFGDMVVLSMEAYERLQLDSEIYFKLLEAEREEAAPATHEDVWNEVNGKLHGNV